MRIHHLNCISSCPLGGRLMDARSPGVLQRGRLCCHCLLLETEAALVLVDTGFGLRDVANPRARLSGFFLSLLSPDFREELTALRQIERLGFRASDVRHIVLTHLDFDHAGGLDDFPQARVHMLRQERETAQAQSTWLDRQRYRPQQWGTRANWQTYPASRGEPWFGFDCVRQLAGLPPEILLVPLPGHTLGHAGVAVQRDGGQWLLQAGDAYFWHEEMSVGVRPRCPSGLRMYQTLMEQDRTQRLGNQQRLRDLRAQHGDAVRVCCSHDPIEYERISGRRMGMPASAAPQTA
ncbi:MBL fold metallo-hydrolase [Ramlibacter sp. AN1015]|uniref:MBL fold metallo-hydrolase n=1 Tax=Ramlibacter sp. AN1015 TaxID=3133428 RepID=UPI0030C14B89